jgi:hypothetical protein
VYTVPPSKASIKQNRFEFMVPGDDKVYEVPKMRYLKPALIADLDQQEKKYAVLRSLLEVYHPGLFDSFEDLDQVESLYNAWGEASGIQVGESSASTGSSPVSTAGPSDETSSSSDAPSTT